MNRSIVITRYARALEKYVRETGGGAVVTAEARTLMQTLAGMPDLSRLISSKDVVAASRKKELLVSALGGKVSPELDKFLDIVLENGRIDLLRDILRSFVDMHDRANGIRRARLTVVRKAPDSLIRSLKALVKEKTGDDVEITVTVDPDILGGFVFDIDDYLLDASVKRQLDIIKEQFIERNRRII